MVFSSKLLQYAIVGRLKRNFILTTDGKAALDTPGGGLIYAAVGLRLWQQGIGLIGRVGEDYRQSWLERMRTEGLDTRGIRVLPETVDLRYFASHIDPATSVFTNPVSEFAKRQLPFPKSLLGYAPQIDIIDSKITPTTETIRAHDIPEDFLDVKAAHFASADFLTHSLLPSIFRQHQVNTITLDASSTYMNPTFWEEIPGLLRGVTVLHCSESRLRNLFKGQTDDIWQMVDAITAMGVELIVVKRGEKGQWVIDPAGRKRWEIPAYPAKVISQTGAGDAFCGGFLGSFKDTYDPLEAALHGNISSSFVVEGTDPFYILDTLPQLINLRLDFLRALVREI